MIDRKEKPPADETKARNRYGVDEPPRANNHLVTDRPANHSSVLRGEELAWIIRLARYLLAGDGLAS